MMDTMILKVTEEGIQIPKEMQEGMDEVRVSRQDGMVIIVANPDEDPIFQFGRDPIKAGIPDASENLDHHLYDTL